MLSQPRYVIQDLYWLEVEDVGSRISKVMKIPIPQRICTGIRGCESMKGVIINSILNSIHPLFNMPHIMYDI